MPVRVYECDKNEVEQLKKVLVYDPYLDPNIIPPAGKDKNVKDLTEEEKKRMEERDKKAKEALDKLAKDKSAQIIFARQNYSLREGKSFGVENDKSYLYLNATEEFLQGAEERFKKEFKTVKRAQKSDEDKLIAKIKEEEEKANAGFGSIFGG